jgi:voltage-gated potassium channel
MPAIIFKRFRWIVITLCCIMLIGTIGYWLLGEGQYSWIDCLYMTVITITTVGFSEVIKVTGNPTAEIFTILIAFSGLGTLTYIFLKITALIVEGELKQTYRKKKMEKKIKSYKDHYIVCGAGRVGSHIIKELHVTKRPTVIIDNNTSTLSSAAESYPEIVYIEGDADDEDILLQAGIKNAKGIFASTGDDNTNLVISLTAKFLNPNIRVVARCLEAVNQAKMKKAGADIVITENYIAALHMAEEMIRPDAVHFLDRMLSGREMNLRVEEIMLNEKYTGKSISSLNMNDFPGTLLLAVITGEEWVFKPGPSQILKSNSKIVVITNPDERLKLKSLS